MILQLDQVRKTYGPLEVLDGLTLRAGAGETVALLGANGSGKTTLLRAIVGLARLDGGRILVDGIDVAADPKRARARLSYVPQRPVFPPAVSVRETLQAVARLRRAAPAAVDRELDWCGLADRDGTAVVRLSGGQRQKLALALAFLADVPLYLFDEPTASLDPEAAALMFERARQLAREGRTILLTTHIAADLEWLQVRVERLVNGRIGPAIDRAGGRPEGREARACRIA